MLRLVLYDHDSLDADDLIGEAKLPLTELKSEEARDLWLDVDCTDPKGGSHDKYKVGMRASPELGALQLQTAGTMPRAHKPEQAVRACPCVIFTHSSWSPVQTGREALHRPGVLRVPPTYCWCSFHADEVSSPLS